MRIASNLLEKRFGIKLDGLILSSGNFLFEVTQESNPQLCRVVATQHVAHKVALDLNLDLWRQIFHINRSAVKMFIFPKFLGI